MCGIVGAFGVVAPDVFNRMLGSISHRGPDYQSALSLGDVYLGHARLSILDLSVMSNQPLWDINERACIIFNGEIYNYQELREHLIDLGYKFLSSGDAEVIVNLFLHYGVIGFEKLNGIFAFAIWDKESERLILARDRLGVKPLYYAQTESGFYFSSELKSLLLVDSISNNLNYDAILRSIVFLWSPGPQTILQDILKLSPGSYLIIQNRKILTASNYVDFEKYKPQKSFSSFNAKKTLDESLKSSIKGQLVSDVPIGSFLSGGLDSSLIVAIIKQLTQNKLPCFTIKSFGSDSCNDGFTDDLQYARQVADYLNVDLNIVEANPNIMQLLPQIVYHLDEPCGDPAPFNVWLICEEARKRGLKVLFSGVGGDDIFSGYRRHQALLFDKLITILPASIGGFLQSFSQVIPANRSIFRRIKKLLSFAGLPERERLLSYFYWIDPKVARDLFTDNIKQKLSDNPLANMLSEIDNLSDLPLLEKMLYLEQKYFLVDHNFNYTDKMSMAHGVEVRVPYLDNELKKVAANIPVKYKRRYGVNKWILKQVAKRYLPKSVIFRSKTGFGVPLRHWLQVELRSLVDDLLSEESIVKRGIFNSDTVRYLITQNNLGKEDYSYPIFTLLCIEQWCRIFIDGK